MTNGGTASQVPEGSKQRETVRENFDTVMERRDSDVPTDDLTGYNKPWWQVRLFFSPNFLGRAAADGFTPTSPHAHWIGPESGKIFD